MIRPTLLAAFVNGPAWLLDQALTRLAPSTPAHVIEAENTRLRDRIKSLEAQRDYLIADMEEADRAEAMRRHPAGSALPTDDDMAELAFVQTVGDILWLTGEDA